MPDDGLPWTQRQWDELRAVALESARRARVASTFLPLVGPVAADQATAPAQWLGIRSDPALDPPRRLEVRSGKTLHLVTIACSVFLRGSEVADPDLDAAKTVMRRAGDVIGRLEDAVIFHGVPRGGGAPRIGPNPVVRPEIYRVTGGRDLTGLLQAPDTLFDREARAENPPGPLTAIRNAVGAGYAGAENAGANGLMVVRLRDHGGNSPIVGAIVAAIQKLEERGHFGPFAVVLGNALFSAATDPTGSLVLPTDRLGEFLDGRKVLRSGVLPAGKGVVVALGGQPIELVLATDLDVKFLQTTLEPRHVLRIYERFVLRIKELDAVCLVTNTDRRLEQGFVPRRAGG